MQTSAINAISDKSIRISTVGEDERIVCYEQAIYSDIRLEMNEWFGLTLEADNQRSTIFTTVQPMYDTVAILIEDNDRKKL